MIRLLTRRWWGTPGGGPGLLWQLPWALFRTGGAAAALTNSLYSRAMQGPGNTSPHPGAAADALPVHPTY